MGGAVVGLGALDDIGDVVLVGAELDINLRGERGTAAPVCILYPLAAKAVTLS